MKHGNSERLDAVVVGTDIIRFKIGRYKGQSKVDQRIHVETISIQDALDKEIYTQEEIDALPKFEDSLPNGFYSPLLRNVGLM